MQNFEAAAEAFKMASALSPDNQLRHEILAELYTMIPEKWLDAVKEHQTLIHQNPNRVESYKALRKIYMDIRQYDKAWCLCSTLAFLKKADPEEQQFFEQYRAKGFVRAKQRLTDEIWVKSIFHPDQDRFTGHIFGAVWQAVALLKAQPHKNFGLKRKDKRDLQTDQLLFSKVFNYVTSVLNVMQPELYLKPDQQIGLMLAHTTEVPSYVVGADLLSEALGSPHALERGMIVEVPGPNGKIVKQIANPIKFSESPPEYRHVGPSDAKANTKDIMRSLGYTEIDFEEFLHTGLFS